MGTDPLAEAYDVHGAAIYRFLCGFLGNRDDAADVLQQVFLKLAMGDPGRIRDIGPYLWSAARNEARRVRRRPPGPILEPRPGRPADLTLQEDLEKALASLPDAQREVLVLHALEGLTFPEIGERLAISPDTASSRFRYAREKMRYSYARSLQAP